MKIKVVINVPDNDCENAHIKAIRITKHLTKATTKSIIAVLFGNVGLRKKDGKYERCVACQSCEVTE